MNCPNDGSVLTMSERQGIEIDYCPTCRGVWLDRGELDKIIERASVDMAPPAQPARPPAAPPPQYYQQRPPERNYDDPDRGYGDRSYGDRGYYGKNKKKKHWLSEIFDD